LHNQLFHSNIIVMSTANYYYYYYYYYYCLLLLLLLRQMAARHIQNSNIHTTQLYKVMAALRIRCGHYIFPCSFFFLSFFFFFPRLISAITGSMSTILHAWCGLSANLECRSETCYTRLAENTGRKNRPKNQHVVAIAQLCRAISS